MSVGETWDDQGRLPIRAEIVTGSALDFDDTRFLRYHAWVEDNAGKPVVMWGLTLARPSLSGDTQSNVATSRPVLTIADFD